MLNDWKYAEVGTSKIKGRLIIDEEEGSRQVEEIRVIRYGNTQGDFELALEELFKKLYGW
jgi:hypothetical protein